MFCSSCGQPVDAGSRFCAACGAAATSSADPVPPPVPPKPPSPPKVPSASVTAAAAPSAAAGTSKGKVLAGGIGGGVVGLIVLARVVIHLFGGSVPACDDDDSIKLVREILDEHGGKGVDASGFAQVSYDSKAEIRSCKAMLSASGSDDDVAKINYTVEWGDKKENKILVTIKGGD
ncbi:MAG: zinc ribbon domain-containing protein [Proteobacteria bacterium]|nr:zinc ribbon domain-containing protein [Pseudomonadota bacterium]MBS0464953.1 zinc ribbon domain-containing protein [Pseudomonadota bacterium]